MIQCHESVIQCMGVPSGHISSVSYPCHLPLVECIIISQPCHLPVVKDVTLFQPCNLPMVNGSERYISQLCLKPGSRSSTIGGTVFQMKSLTLASYSGQWMVQCNVK